MRINMRDVLFIHQIVLSCSFSQDEASDLVPPEQCISVYFVEPNIHPKVNGYISWICGLATLERSLFYMSYETDRAFTPISTFCVPGSTFQWIATLHCSLKPLCLSSAVIFSAFTSGLPSASSPHNDPDHAALLTASQQCSKEAHKKQAVSFIFSKCDPPGYCFVGSPKTCPQNQCL